MASSGRKIPANCYSVRSAQRLTGATGSQIVGWALCGLIQPSIPRVAGGGHWRLYTAADLLCIKAAHELRLRGVSLEAMRPAIAALRDLDPVTISRESFLLVAETGATVASGKQLLPTLQQAARGAVLLHLGKLAEELKRGLLAA